MVPKTSYLNPKDTGTNIRIVPVTKNEMNLNFFAITYFFFSMFLLFFVLLVRPQHSSRHHSMLKITQLAKMEAYIVIYSNTKQNNAILCRLLTL